LPVQGSHSEQAKPRAKAMSLSGIHQLEMQKLDEQPRQPRDLISDLVTANVQVDENQETGTKKPTME
jgi:hypothetical protein